MLHIKPREGCSVTSTWGLIWEYVKEFFALTLKIPDTSEEQLPFNFMDNLQGWAEQELRRGGVQDLASTMVVA